MSKRPYVTFAEPREVARAFVSTDHPLLAHIIPIRRCNLSCDYCNEYDDFSKPVPTEDMFRRIDKLAELGTVVDHHQWRRAAAPSGTRRHHRRIRQHGMVAGLITNGYLLVPERIERLNRAGLDGCRFRSTTSCPMTSRRRA